jgi:hypothetical protein
MRQVMTMVTAMALLFWQVRSGGRLTRAMLCVSHTPSAWFVGFLGGLPLSLLSRPLGPDQGSRRRWMCLAGTLLLVACYAGWAEILADGRQVRGLGRGWPFPDRLVEGLTLLIDPCLAAYYLGTVAFGCLALAGLVLGALLHPAPPPVSEDRLGTHLTGPVPDGRGLAPS